MAILTTTPKLHKNPVYAGYICRPVRFSRERHVLRGGNRFRRMPKAKRLARLLTVLQSKNSYTWHFAANALVRPLPSLGNNFWAPEVAFNDGWFYMYYSVGHGDKNHQLRVAKSRDPQGPYTDLGISLVDPARCPFAIDPHPFKDDDDQWYLFYARDFLHGSGGRVGTGLMVAKTWEL